MCENCWAEHGSPTEWNADIDRARGLILAIETECGTCAPLHATVENWNVEKVDEPLDYFPPHIMEAARELARLLTGMTIAERASTLAYADGYADTPPDASREWEDLVESWWRAEGMA